MKESERSWHSFRFSLFQRNWKWLCNLFFYSLDNISYLQVQTFERRCLTFFVELVTEFCFVRDDSREIEPKLLQRIMGYAFHAKENQTKQFSPVEDFAIDPTPIIRSFILQQLLKRWAFYFWYAFNQSCAIRDNNAQGK